MREAEVYRLYQKCQRMVDTCNKIEHINITRKYVRMARDYVDQKYGSRYVNSTQLFASSFKRNLFWHQEFDNLMWRVGYVLEK